MQEIEVLDNIRRASHFHVSSKSGGTYGKVPAGMVCLGREVASSQRQSLPAILILFETEKDHWTQLPEQGFSGLELNLEGHSPLIVMVHERAHSKDQHVAL